MRVRYAACTRRTLAGLGVAAASFRLGPLLVGCLWLSAACGGSGDSAAPATGNTAHNEQPPSLDGGCVIFGRAQRRKRRIQSFSANNPSIFFSSSSSVSFGRSSLAHTRRPGRSRNPP